MNTPVVDFVRRYAQQRTTRMHMPGHKGRGPLGCEELDITEIAGADELYEALDPLAKGYYMNEIDLDRFPQLARKAFSEEKWNKLLAVRKQYDPEQRFVSYLDKA